MQSGDPPEFEFKLLPLSGLTNIQVISWPEIQREGLICIPLAGADVIWKTFSAVVWHVVAIKSAWRRQAELVTRELMVILTVRGSASNEFSQQKLTVFPSTANNGSVHEEYTSS